MQKNVTGQKWIVFAFDRTDNTPKTGDAANITGNLRIDGGAANAIDDTNPAELEDGYYIFDITQAESNGDMILITPESSTGDIQVIGTPAALYTTAANFNALGIESDGDLTKVDLVATTTTNTDMVGTDSALLASSAPTNFGALGIESDGDITKVNLCANTTLVDTVTTNTDLVSVADILTTQMTEAYAADTVAPTLAQAIFLIQQTIQQFAITGTTITVKKLDKSTTAATYTMDDDNSPTSRTRAS